MQGVISNYLYYDLIEEKVFLEFIDVTVWSACRTEEVPRLSICHGFVSVNSGFVCNFVCQVVWSKSKVMNFANSVFNHALFYSSTILICEPTIIELN